MKRRIIALLAVLCLLVICTAAAESVTESFGKDFSYHIEPERGILTVSGSGRIPAFKNSNYPWVNYARQIRGIILEEGITGIPGEAFRDCYYLTGLILPESLDSINVSAFRGCKNVQGIWVPENNTSARDAIQSGKIAGLKGENVFAFDREKQDEIIETILKFKAEVSQEELRQPAKKRKIYNDSDDSNNSNDSNDWTPPAQEENKSTEDTITTYNNDTYGNSETKGPFSSHVDNVINENEKELRITETKTYTDGTVVVVEDVITNFTEDTFEEAVPQTRTVTTYDSAGNVQSSENYTWTPRDDGTDRYMVVDENGNEGYDPTSTGENMANQPDEVTDYSYKEQFEQGSGQ